MDELNKTGGRKASLLATMKAVFWSFLGIRKRSDYEHDSANLNPLHLIIAALIGVLLFIGVLVAVVKIAVAK
jgi:amino acid transporter